MRAGRVRPPAPVEDFYAAGGDVPGAGDPVELAAVEQVPPVLGRVPRQLSRSAVAVRAAGGAGD